MTADTYTKTILSIIALCLTINVIKDFDMIPSAHAENVPNTNTTKNEVKYHPLPISDTGTIDVRIVAIKTYDELNVNLKSVDTYDEVKVNIKGIETTDELDINIDEVGGRFISEGKIDVRIK